MVPEAVRLTDNALRTAAGVQVCQKSQNGPSWALDNVHPGNVGLGGWMAGHLGNVGFTFPQKYITTGIPSSGMK